MRMTIKTRLISLLSSLGLLLLASDIAGTFSLHAVHKSFKSVYDDRVVCLRQFNTIQISLAHLIAVSRMVSRGKLDADSAREQIKNDVADIEKIWADYMTTYLTSEEKLIASDLRAQLDRAEAIAGELSLALTKRQGSDLVAIHAEVEKEGQVLDGLISRMSAFQVREASAEFGRSEVVAGWSRLALFTMLALAVLAIAFGVYTILTQVIRPLGTITGTMARLAAGDLEASVAGTGRVDEVGAMAKAVQVFKDAMIAKRDADAAAAAENDTKMRRAQVLDEATRSFQAQVTQLTQGLSSAATEMEATAKSMSRTADETAGQSVAVASAAQQTSSNVQTVAAASEEMAASIREIATHVARSSEMAERAVADATHTGEIVSGLAESAERIGAVVGLISGIAAQTNLLALNATIEAARAGDAGRGFAVVAGEVKELATQTAKATETIAQQVNAIQSGTRGAVTAIHAISTTILELRGIAASVAAAMEEQGAATQEIVRNVSHAAEGTQSVTESIGSVTRAAGETGTASSQVLAAATELSRQSEKLGAEVSGFLTTVRAA